MTDEQHALLFRMQEKDHGSAPRKLRELSREWWLVRHSEDGPTLQLIEHPVPGHSRSKPSGFIYEEAAFGIVLLWTQSSRTWFAHPASGSRKRDMTDWGDIEVRGDHNMADTFMSLWFQLKLSAGS